MINIKVWIDDNGSEISIPWDISLEDIKKLVTKEVENQYNKGCVKEIIVESVSLNW